MSAFVKDFGGSHRFVLDYVQQDILARLPVALEHFLLQTSIFTRMNAAACQAVMAGPDLASSQHLLEEVERANLFVSPNTIKSQVGSIYRKLNVRSRLQAYAAAQRLRLL